MPFINHWQLQVEKSAALNEAVLKHSYSGSLHHACSQKGWCAPYSLVNYLDLFPLQIGVSFAQSTVSSFVVDLSRVPKSDSIPHGLIRDDQPLVPPTPTGSSLRRIYDRPSTSCSKPQRWGSLLACWVSKFYGNVPGTQCSLSLCQYGFPWQQLFFYSRVKHNSESERHSPSSEDDRDEKESKAEIQNQEDYKEIFQPKNAICQYQGLWCFWVAWVWDQDAKLI